MSRREPLPRRPLAELVNPAPAAGTGLHAWAFYAANAARGYGFQPGETAAFVVEAMIRAGRPHHAAERETRDAVGKAFALDDRGFVSSRPIPPPAPKADAALMAATAKDGPGLYDLWEATPVRFDRPQAAEIYRALMGPDPETLVCVAKEHPRDAVTIQLSEALALVGTHALTCQSPMAAPLGLTQDGKPSPRCLDNCGPRRWAVVEFDPDASKPEWAQFEEPVDAMAAFIWKLNELTEGGLAVATHSGGKSLHGWFDAAGMGEAALALFYAVARKFGADMATRSPVQLVRLPDGRRADGRRQTAYFFNPFKTEAANEYR